MLVAAWTSAAAYALYFAGMALLHFLPTGREPLYHTVGDYALGRFGSLARAMTALNVLGTLGARSAPRARAALRRSGREISSRWPLSRSQGSASPFS